MRQQQRRLPPRRAHQQSPGAQASLGCAEARTGPQLALLLIMGAVPCWPMTKHSGGRYLQAGAFERAMSGIRERELPQHVVRGQQRDRAGGAPAACSCAAAASPARSAPAAPAAPGWLSAPLAGPPSPTDELQGNTSRRRTCRRITSRVLPHQ